MDREIVWIWSRRFVFVVLSGFIILIQYLPIEDRWPNIPGPDAIVAICFAWTLRRPEIMSPILIAATLLFADLMLSRPPGLWALIVLAGSVYLATRQRDLNQALFGVEWMYVSITILICFLVNYLAMFVFFLPTQNGLITAVQCLITILIYPIVVVASSKLFGIQKTVYSETN